MATDEVHNTAYLAAIVESSDVAIYSEDLTETIVSWNSAAEQMFGYSAADAVGRPIYLIVPDEWKAEERDIQRRIHAGEHVGHYNTVRRRKDGRRIHVSMVASPVRTPAGVLVGVSKVARDITAQKQLEAQLSLKRALIELSREAIFAWDLNDGIVEWNTGCERLYGYARDEVIGRVSHELLETIHPQPLESVLASLIDRREWAGELRHRTRDRREVVVESRQQLIEIDGRSLVLETNRDISERNRAEERFRLALDSAPTAMLIIDRRGTITFANGLAERLFGYTRAELLARTVEDLVPARFRRHHADYRTHFFSELSRRTMGAGRDLYALRKDGCEVPVEIGLSPFHNDDDVFVIAAVTDISERKRASQHAAFLAEAGTVLAGSLDYSRTLETLANLAVPSIADWCAVDIVTENRKLERLAVAHVDPAKIALASTVRERYEDPSSPLSPAAVARTGTPAIVKEISDQMIVDAAHGDDQRVGLVRSLGLRSYMVVPLTTGGRTLGTLTLATAESGRLYTDDDFRFAQDVAFRAALAVDNARAYNDATAANRLKDEFLATLSHELRTPLNAILGYARLVQSGMLPADKHAGALNTVERNATALAQIVDDILDVARIISGKIRLNIQAVDLPNVVSNAIETVMPAAHAKGIRIQTLLDPRAAPISGDPDRLQQIVWNLVSNAVKFTPKHGTVQVRLERVNSHVEIVVSDTGIGIAPDFVPYIFERFRQEDSGIAREHGGLGLGLAIVRHLVEMHGGTIHAASEGRDKGSTFRVRLPVMSVRREAPEERRARPASDLALTAAQLPDLHGLSVLAVDDDADARALVSETLETRGARVISVDSADAAMRVLETQPPDVVLADIGMAHHDGFELIKRIRQFDDHDVRNVPAAALTAYARAEDRVKVLQSGFQMHLAKPVDPAELIIAVASLAGLQLKE